MILFCLYYIKFIKYIIYIAYINYIYNCIYKLYIYILYKYFYIMFNLFNMLYILYRIKKTINKKLEKVKFQRKWERSIVFLASPWGGWNKFFWDVYWCLWLWRMTVIVDPSPARPVSNSLTWSGSSSLPLWPCCQNGLYTDYTSGYVTIPKWNTSVKG